MIKHIEMIIDYVTDGTDFQYGDNLGVLTRCKDCVFADGKLRICRNFDGLRGELGELDYCSKAVRKDVQVRNATPRILTRLSADERTYKA